MSAEATTFNRGAVRPVECVKAGYEAIRDQYWLCLGITFVGVLLGSLVPFGIIMGAMMIGVHMCMLKKLAGQPVEFEIVFKGFDHFAQSFVATLVHLIPTFVIIVPIYIVFVFTILGMAAASENGNVPPELAAGVPFVFFIVIFLAVMVLMVLNLLLSFSYQLIFDRGLSGIDACKVSCKAVLANFGGMFLLVLLMGLMGIGGLVLCYVGVFLVMPISMAAMNAAYRQVFPPLAYQPQSPYGVPPEHPWQGPPPTSWPQG